jgi:hypothetical protein
MSRITYGPDRKELKPSSWEAITEMMQRDSERIALERDGMVVPEDEQEVNDQSRNNSVVRNQGS